MFLCVVFLVFFTRITSQNNRKNTLAEAILGLPGGFFEASGGSRGSFGAKDGSGEAPGGLSDGSGRAPRPKKVVQEGLRSEKKLSKRVLMQSWPDLR